LASRIKTTYRAALSILCGLLAMLLFTVQAFSIFDLVRLLMSLIGKVISSIIIFLFKNPEQFLALSWLYIQE
jgi:hypothetical protein